MISKRIGIYAAIVLGIFGAGWQVNGWRYDARLSDMQADHYKALQAAGLKVRQAEQAARNRIASLDAQIEAARAETKTITETVEREVIKYVQSPAAKCDLDPDWVRIHNASVSRDTRAAGKPYDSPKGVRADQALITITENYRSCISEYDKLKGLQDYVRAIHE